MRTLHKIITIIVVSMLVFSGCESYNEEENTFSENEPNDAFGTATVLTLGETYDAKINPIAEKDYFICTTDGTKKVTVDGGSGLELYVKAYDQDQIEFYGGDTMERGAAITFDINSTDYSGKFYIMIESAYGNDTGTYTIKVE